jgi:hypothetical protein
MRLIGRLFAVAFGLVFAITASGFFLMVASVVDPVMAVLTGNTLFVGFWALMDAIFAAADPDLVVEGALAGIGHLTFALLVAPPAFVALVSEVIGARRLLWHAGLTGLLTAAVPWLLRGSGRVSSPEELHVGFVLGLTGAVAGFVYWMIAGRSAGFARPAAPPPIAPMPRES